MARVSKKDTKFIEDGKSVIDSAALIIQDSKEEGSWLWSLRKLLTGIFMLSLSAVFCTQYRGYQKMHIDNYIVKNWLSFLEVDTAKGVIGFMTWILACVAILWFVRGVNKTFTFNTYVEDIDSAEPILIQLKRAFTETYIESGSTSSNSKNIDTLISYRDSKLGALTYEQKANLMRQTSFLDAARAGVYTGKNAKETVSYMNSRLGAKTFEQGLDYISGKN